MSFEKGDFLICRVPQSKRNFLMSVSSLDGCVIRGNLARDAHIPSRRSAVEVVPRDVVINLGKDPRPGKVYGVEIERVVGHKEHDTFGRIHFFYKPHKDVGANIMDALDKTAKILRKNRLDFIVGEEVWEVFAPKGNRAGAYARSRKPDVNPSRFRLFPEVVPASEYPYVLCHELAHHLHASFMDNTRLNAAWIKLFNTSIKPTSIPKDKSLELLRGVLSHDGPPSTFSSTLSDEDTRTFRWVMRTIQAYRAVSIKELDTLYEGENVDAIEDLWPKRAIPLKELAPVVSQYATKNYRELLAESVAFYLVGKDLPADVTKLVERSLTYARKAQGN